MSQKTQAAIEKIVRDTLSKSFDHIRIKNISVQKDIDGDGDEILRINVVFAGSPKRVDVSKLTGLVRLLRPQLNKIREYAFPVLSFISNADYNASAF